MIISHSRRFIFVKTMKTAGTSLEMALARHCAPEDVLTPLEGEEEAERRRIAGSGARNYLEPLSAYTPKERLRALVRGRWKRRFAEHTPAWMIRRRVPKAVWDGYFKFAVVRDPFDRIVSRFFYTAKYFGEHGLPEIWDRGDVDQFLRYHAELVNENWPMYTEKDRITLDFLVRYEHLEADLAEVSRRIGLDHNIHDDLVAIRAKGGYRPARTTASDILSTAQSELVALLCAKEIEAFDYGARQPAAAARG